MRLWPRKRKSDPQVAALFRRAANRLETKGWQQWHMGLAAGPNCGTGALFHETDFGGLDIYEAACKAVRPAIGKSLPAWNDEPQRTAEDVIALFQKLAKEAESR